MKYGAIIGAVVGVAIFVLTYTINNNPIYLIFIPIAAGMGWAMQYVKDEGPED
jgi:drug/metabolite transporter (DMT)-like permease